VNKGPTTDEPLKSLTSGSQPGAAAGGNSDWLALAADISLAVLGIRFARCFFVAQPIYDSPASPLLPKRQSPCAARRLELNFITARWNSSSQGEAACSRASFVSFRLFAWQILPLSAPGL